ncbi:MAG: TRAP transporter large permease [Peptococcaceae bacterium]
MEPISFVGPMFIIMIILILLKTPVAYAILASNMIFLLTSGLKPLTLVSVRMVAGLNSFPLLAVPLFILAGNLMDKGGISKRLIVWAENLVGWMPGGTGVVAIVSSTIFAALTGSGPATVAAIGSIMIPSLITKDYTVEQSAGMVAAAGALGPIIPPSIPMIIYGVTMSLSIPDMFIAGILPGLFIAGLLIIVNMVIAYKNPKILNHRNDYSFNFRRFLRTTLEASGALLMPIIILGGIYGGIFTPTEAASIGVVYGLFVGIFIYREIKIKELPKVLISSMETSAMVNIIIAAAALLSWIIASTHTSSVMVSFLTMFVHNKLMYLLILNITLFIVGALIDTVAAIIIVAPVLVPIGIELGVDPLHLGVLFVINLVIGYVTPPFGYNLFTACSVTGLKFDRILKGVVPYLLVEIFAVLILTYIPGIITWLPSILAK